MPYIQGLATVYSPTKFKGSQLRPQKPDVMQRLPIIAGFGGISAAGVSSGHNAYKRLVFDALPKAEQASTLASLAALTGRIDASEAELLESSLIRKLEDKLFDPDAMMFHQRMVMIATHGQEPLFECRKTQLPNPLPPGWEVVEDNPEDRHVTVRASQGLDVLLPSHRKADVNSAGQLPTGFDPSTLYQSRNHPCGLQMTVFAASDAINSLGMGWNHIIRHVAPDQVSVYAGSGMSQLDYNGYGGMMQARLVGRKVTSKQLPLGYAEMPADFVNAYLLGNLGTTGTNVAACATFLYNLRQGVRDIQSGSHRIAIVGTSEAPLLPEVFDGFNTMGALADDASLRGLDGLNPEDAPDYRRACRPFGYNAGFTLAESAQFMVLMDDELALELGANVLGSVNDVFINADGYKKSIASPGLGNYISLAKAAAATKNIIGEEGLQRRSYVQAHGTGTLQNRQTESHIIDEIARVNGIDRWPVSAVKTYVGHSLASAAGDQLMSVLGVWKHGFIPGITTIDKVADDVAQKHAEFLLEHREVDGEMDAVVVNSKGFGGNNASASVLSPSVTQRMLEKRHGRERMAAYQSANEKVAEQTAAYQLSMAEGKNSIIYKFDNNVLDHDAIQFKEGMKIEGWEREVNLDLVNLYSDMCD